MISVQRLQTPLFGPRSALSSILSYDLLECSSSLKPDSKPAMTATPSEGSKIPSPTKLAHIVLRTSFAKYDKIVDFYKTFLGGVVIPSDNISFIRYDDEHHCLAIIRLDIIDSGLAHPTSPGLDHICFTSANLKDLATIYRIRKSLSILPV
jgi:hypothetical protein